MDLLRRAWRCSGRQSPTVISTSVKIRPEFLPSTWETPVRPYMKMIARLALALLFYNTLILPPAPAQSSLPDHPQPQQSLPDAPTPQSALPEHPRPQASANAAAPPPQVDDAWPRKATRGDETISMYQPQLEA